MKVSKLIERLQKLQEKHGDVDVMFTGDDEGPFSVGSVKYRVAEEDEYPDDFAMPKGYEFIELNVW
jgi:hypothetical protein